MYHSNQYMQIAKSTALPGLDLMTIPSYLDEYDDVVKDNIKNQTNDFIYTKKSRFDSDTLKLIEENYILVEDSDMPESLHEQLWIAKRLK
jgi:hypothetical protein